ncbi:acetyl-CoA hydrolase/transferase family protein [Pseudenhygromyxa sp. WMMC2535]|uniref:acetyl-CoA hydrolase/transferase family protein n=1 Tax=Pseudenhygromyxa sp. WMMC2535 TaxID=2712867 RepID=UPI0015563A0A|nr:acetyl-CoA hydrolase/transferase family protein [Pseudenhygromyxa sp. WMMC2535]NVB43245.1 acetyl-CoA hydrolase/transferase family protein [Pseudenhygromyxa sp. WMMC2535]
MPTDKQPPLRSAAEAVAKIRSGQRVFVGSGAAEPERLVEAMTARHAELRGVEVYSILTLGGAPYVAPEYAESFRHVAFFIGHNTREAVQSGRADFMPIFLSEIPALFRERVPIDWALIQVSPPDKHGYCTVGVAADVVVSAMRNARYVVAEINSNMPRTWGDTLIHVSELYAAVEVDTPIPELVSEAIDGVSETIGANVAGLVQDADCLQLGIGAIPNAVLAGLRGHKRLGVHTEMLSDGIVELVEAGVIDCSAKNYRPHKAICSFVMGTRRLYDFVDDNPFVESYGNDFVNDPFIIARNDNMVAINSAIQIDLSGQVCADSMGARPFSGIGGQVDFIRGAARSQGGRAIIALPSTAKKGAISRIVSTLKPGAGVVTSRGDVRFVVTEHGVADLYAKPISERARALIGIADPRFRDQLEREARELDWL